MIQPNTPKLAYSMRQLLVLSDPDLDHEGTKSIGYQEFSCSLAYKMGVSQDDIFDQLQLTSGPDRAIDLYRKNVYQHMRIISRIFGQ